MPSAPSRRRAPRVTRPLLASGLPAQRRRDRGRGDHVSMPRLSVRPARRVRPARPRHGRLRGTRARGRDRSAFGVTPRQVPRAGALSASQRSSSGSCRPSRLQLAPFRSASSCRSAWAPAVACYARLGKQQQLLGFALAIDQPVRLPDPDSLLPPLQSRPLSRRAVPPCRRPAVAATPRWLRRALASCTRVRPAGPVRPR